jgi:hypothetical protein
MKIAVVLRGQPRNSKIVADLFDKFVRQNCPDIEFATFIHTSRRISILQDESKKTVILNNRFNGKDLSLDEVIESILPWRPVRYYIEDEQKFFHYCKLILNELSNDYLIHNWWEWINGQNGLDIGDNNLFNGSDLIIPFLSDFRGIYCWKDHFNSSIEDKYDYKGIKYNISDIPAMLRVVSFHHVMRQYYSFLQSYNVLKDAMNNNPSYKPDLIWFTRLDTVHTSFFGSLSEALERIHNYLQFCQDDEKFRNMGPETCGIITTNRVVVDRGRPWIDDLDLFSNVESMEIVMGNRTPEDIIISAFKNNKFQLLNCIGSGCGLQHTLWSPILNKSIFLQSPSIKTSVFRDTYHIKMEGLHELDNSNESIEKFFKYDEGWVHPGILYVRGPTEDEVISEYRRLNGDDK